MLFRYRVYINPFGDYFVKIQQKKFFWWEFKHLKLDCICETMNHEFQYYKLETNYVGILDTINKYDSFDNMIYNYIYRVIKEEEKYKVSEENKAKEFLDSIANGKWSRVFEINVEEI